MRTESPKRSWVLVASVAGVAWIAAEARATVTGFVEDQIRALTPWAPKLALLAAIAMLPVVLLLALAHAAFEAGRTASRAIRRAALNLALVLALAVRISLAIATPSPVVLRPRPAF